MNEQKKIWVQDVAEKNRAFEVNEDVGKKFLAKRWKGEPTYKQVSAPPSVATVDKLTIDLQAEKSARAKSDAELAAANARIAALEGKAPKGEK